MGFFVIFFGLMVVGFLISICLCYALRPWRRLRTDTIWGISVMVGLATPFALAALFLFGAIPDSSVTDHYSQPITVEEARSYNCPINIPDGATKVQFGEDSGGFPGNYEYLVRFEAPLDICRACAGKHLEPLKERPTPISGFMFRDAPWFDIQNISHGETSGNPGGMGDQYWIDDDRGILYFRKCG